MTTEGLRGWIGPEHRGAPAGRAQPARPMLSESDLRADRELQPLGPAYLPGPVQGEGVLELTAKLPRDLRERARANLELQRATHGRDRLRGDRDAFASFAQEDPRGVCLLHAYDAVASPPPRPRAMGILNLTPDSFSDGGRFAAADGRVDPGAVVAEAHAMIEAGACWLDLGAESTRPGAPEIPVREELARVQGSLEALAQAGLIERVSLDTRKAEVARLGVELGIGLLNDVSGGRFDPELLEVAAQSDVDLVLMHMRGEPGTMRGLARYDEVVQDVAAEWRDRRLDAVCRGVRADRIWFDPGIGFAKDTNQNLALVRRLAEFRALGAPLLLGVSRKAFVGAATGVSEPQNRGLGTAAAVAAGALSGAALLRVHDLAAAREVLDVSAALLFGEVTP